MGAILTPGLALAFAAGAALGAVYFAVLGAAVRDLAGGGGAGRFALAALLRAALVLGGLAALALLERPAADYLAAAVGFTLARVVSLRLGRGGAGSGGTGNGADGNGAGEG